VEASELDVKLSLKKYLDWAQFIEGIFELKEYNNEKSFKLVVLEYRGVCIPMV